jgi:hypothetical protein
MNACCGEQQRECKSSGKDSTRPPTWFARAQCRGRRSPTGQVAPRSAGASRSLNGGGTLPDVGGACQPRQYCCARWFGCGLRSRSTATGSGGYARKPHSPVLFGLALQRSNGLPSELRARREHTSRWCAITPTLAINPVIGRSYSVGGGAKIAPRRMLPALPSRHPLTKRFTERRWAAAYQSQNEDRLPWGQEPVR